MYILGIPERQYRRTTQVLGPESSEPIEYNSEKQDDGFYLFQFPNCDEYRFREIVNLLKNNGVTTIGADTQLTENKIMKLSNLIKKPLNEQGSPDENDLIDILKDTLKRMESKDYRGGGFEACDLSNHYLEEIREVIEDYTENMYMDMPDTSMNEQDVPTTGGKVEKFKVDVEGEMVDVTLDKGHATGMQDVTISWGDESHNVNFEEMDPEEVEDHDNEGKDMVFRAISRDKNWEFALDVSVEADYDMSGNVQDIDWRSLEIEKKDTPPQINESYFKTQMQKRAGIIK